MARVFVRFGYEYHCTCFKAFGVVSSGEGIIEYFGDIGEGYFRKMIYVDAFDAIGAWGFVGEGLED